MSYSYSSYNSLTVPLDMGTWECMLMLCRDYEEQARHRQWSRRDRLREEDERAFGHYFRPDYDLRTITGGHALQEIQRFLSDHLNVAHWNLPSDNAGIERALKQAVSDGKLVPVVNRDYRLMPRTFSPTPAPLRWPSSSGGGVARSASSTMQWDSMNAVSVAAETIARAVQGGDDTDAAPAGDGAVADTDAFVCDDASTSLADAQPFVYVDDLPNADAEQIAGMPFNGTPGSWASSMPGSMRQLRQYGLNGTPLTDIDFEAHHGNPNPHAHNWEGTYRDEGAPVSLLPW